MHLVDQECNPIPTVVTLMLVDRLRVAVPPRAQTVINSVTEAPPELRIIPGIHLHHFYRVFKVELEDFRMIW